MDFISKVKSAVSKNSADDEEQTVFSVQVEDNDALNRKIDDILELLSIKDTFEIPPEVFLPEDLKDVRFDIQVPSGYDTGQVTRFVHQTRNSIKFLTELLKRRNDDIAKLATMIDKLQVDVNNQKFEAEIANGISVMPTEDDPGLENKLMEAKLEIRRLEDKLKAAGSGTGLSDNERESYGVLQDELSLSRRQSTQLEVENQRLRGQVAHLEETLDDLQSPDQFVEPKPLTESELAELGLPSLDRNQRKSALPGATAGFVLPEKSMIDVDSSDNWTPNPQSNNFDLDD